MVLRHLSAVTGITLLALLSPAALAEPDLSGIGDIPSAAPTADDLVAVEEEIKAAGPQPAKLKDPAVIHLYHRKAYMLAKRGDFAPALVAMRKARSAERLNASLVKNAAKLESLAGGRGNCVRGARDIITYLKGREPDEEMFNLAGFLLDRATQQGLRPPEVLQRDLKALEAGLLAKRLKSDKPEKRRWGSRWIGEQEWQEIEEKRRAAEVLYRQSKVDMAEAKSDFEAARRRYNQYLRDEGDDDRRSGGFSTPRGGRSTGRGSRSRTPTGYDGRVDSATYSNNLSRLSRGMTNADARYRAAKENSELAKRDVPVPEWVASTDLEIPDPNL